MASDVSGTQRKGNKGFANNYALKEEPGPNFWAVGVGQRACVSWALFPRRARGPTISWLEGFRLVKGAAPKELNRRFHHPRISQNAGMPQAFRRLVERFGPASGQFL